MTSGQRIIYDIGSNNGDDIPYYLLKAEKVIAVEANPTLCDFISKRFQNEINNNRLVVENCAITEDQDGTTDFYLHNQHHVLGTAVSPDVANQASYTRISVKAVSVGNLIATHGQPHYVKIDLEGYDELILKAFATNQIFPPYISAESATIGVFALLSEKLRYKSFKLLEGPSINRIYNPALIWSPLIEKYIAYSFPHHSAGPFGNDIHGEWMNKNTLLKVLAMQGLGWKDIHASTQDTPTLAF